MSDAHGTSGAPGEREALGALSRIHDRIGEPQAGAEALDTAQLCKTYHDVKPLLLAVLPWLERLGDWGRQLAAAIRFLMSIADRLCPA